MVKENIKKILEERNKQIAEECKKINDYMSACQILLYETSNGTNKDLEEGDNRWEEFCNKVFRKNSIENGVIEYLMREANWAEEISFIWTKREYIVEILIKLNPTAMFNSFDGSGKRVIIKTNKRWKKVKVYIYH